MKKIIFSLVIFSFLFASVSLANDGRGTSTNATSTKKVIDVACFQQITGTREDAIIAAFNTRNQAVATALTTRKTAMIAAFAKETNRERVAALVLAQRNFWTERNKANNVYKKTTKEAWQKFRTDRKGCKGINNVTTELMNQNGNDLVL